MNSVLRHTCLFLLVAGLVLDSGCSRWEFRRHGQYFWVLHRKAAQPTTTAPDEQRVYILKKSNGYIAELVKVDVVAVPRGEFAEIARRADRIVARIPQPAGRLAAYVIKEKSARPRGVRVFIEDVYGGQDYEIRDLIWSDADCESVRWAGEKLLFDQLKRKGDANYLPSGEKEILASGVGRSYEIDMTARRVVAVQPFWIKG